METDVQTQKQNAFGPIHGMDGDKKYQTNFKGCQTQYIHFSKGMWHACMHCHIPRVRHRNVSFAKLLFPILNDTLLWKLIYNSSITY